MFSCVYLGLGGLVAWFSLILVDFDCLCLRDFWFWFAVCVYLLCGCFILAFLFLCIIACGWVGCVLVDLPVVWMLWLIVFCLCVLFVVVFT